ncbi:MAG: hypothetical protein CL912_29215 [Deltaproteobacteria bacterium]|nr:hypothetical protein [Deltaproteobacteria bacterium]
MDYFDHGQSKFTPSPYQIAGEDDFNFAVDVLQQVKHVHQRPCHEKAQKGFRAITFATFRATLMFRHKLLERLAARNPLH